MALKATYAIRCGCGTRFSSDLYEYVFAEHDPELKDSILSGEFNRISCPSCAQALPIENRFLYRDERNKLWVWVCGKEEAPERDRLAGELIERDSVIKGHFLDDQETYRKFLVFGRDGLIELLLREDRDLKRTEARSLKRNPALRWIREGSEDPGFLFLRGNKISVAIPLRLPADRRGRVTDSEENRRWLRFYAQGLNMHNPFSSFLDERSRARWNRIRENEPDPESINEYDDFASSWARYRTDVKRFGSRYPERRKWFDVWKRRKVFRTLRSIPSRPTSRESS